MKQTPYSDIETAAMNAALKTVLEVRPDVEGDKALYALLKMVARETCRELSAGLSRNGYLSSQPKEPVNNPLDFLDEFFSESARKKLDDFGPLFDVLKSLKKG